MRRLLLVVMTDGRPSSEDFRTENECVDKYRPLARRMD